MTKPFMLFGLIALGLSGTAAEPDEVPGVAVVTQEGTTTVEKSEVARINLTASQVEMIMADGQSFVFDKASVQEILLSATTLSGVIAAPSDQYNVWPAVVSDQLNIEGPDGAVYTLFDMNGVLRLTGSLSGGSVTISTSHLSNGIYLLTVGGHTYKLIKK